MVVAVDIGNSAIKLAFESDPTEVTRIEASSSLFDQEQRLSSAISCMAPHDLSWHVCSVNQNQTEWLEAWVSRQRPNDRFHVITADDIPLQSKVDDRKALGRDRLLASWYGNVLSNGAPSIVIDAGTAVTIDVATEDCHIGGLIFPGTKTCLAALASQTDALPNLLQQPPPQVSNKVQLGTATEPAILLGVHQLQLFGIVAMTTSLASQFPNATVFACGGSLSSMISVLPESWRYEKTFVTDAIFNLSRSFQR